MSLDSEIGILKTLWGRGNDGRWIITSLKAIDLKRSAGFEPDFFRFESEMELLTQSPRNMHEFFTSFGPTDFLLKQSIVPVVAWVNGENSIRCIGTAFVISCTGYVMTACHVLLDPQERGYGKVIRDGNALFFGKPLKMGVFIPMNPASGTDLLFQFLPFESCWYWGEWKESPLFNVGDQFSMLTDIAICKIPPLSENVAHQPLSLSLRHPKLAETAYAIGYAEMDDIQLEIIDGKQVLSDFKHELYASIGKVTNVYPENHNTREIMTPGPAFEFAARIPGKMSGGPIFGMGGVVVRGVVSRSFSGEKLAYGAMVRPMMGLPLTNGQTLDELLRTGNEGIAKFEGPDV